MTNGPRIRRNFIMNQSVFRLVAISSLSLLLALAATTTYLVNHSASNAAARPAPDNAVKEIPGYSSWVKVNPTPEVMQSKTALLCAAPAGGNRIYGADNPHHEKFITVYVNPAGRP